MVPQFRMYYPYISPFDPCPPIRVKMFVTPPNLYIPYQPPNLPQFDAREALFKGTLWPALFSPYGPEREGSEAGWMLPNQEVE